MKLIEESVIVKYKGKTFNGFLRIARDAKTLEFLINDSDFKEALLSNKSYETFYIEMVNGVQYSCFHCFRIRIVSGLNFLFVYNIGKFIEGFIENYDTFSLNSFSALFPSVDCIFKGETKPDQCTTINFKSKEIKITASQTIHKYHDWFKSNEKSSLLIKIESSNGLDLGFTEEVFFNISAIFSFLCDAYVSYESIEYKKFSDKKMDYYKIIPDILIEDNNINMFNNNYGVLGQIPWTDITKMLNLLNLPFLKVLLIYSGILRTKPLLEDKYLDYSRCLEIIARENTEKVIYNNKQLNAKKKKYKEIITNMDLNDEYKDNLIDAFKFSNKRSFKEMLLELISNQSWGHKVRTEKKGLDMIIKDIVNIRNGLTHENLDEIVNLQSLQYYCKLVKEILVAVLLWEYGYDYEHDAKEMMKKYRVCHPTRMRELIKKLDDVPSPIIKMK